MSIMQVDSPSDLVCIVLWLGLSWVVVKAVARLTKQSPLDNLPGPKSPSWLTGEQQFVGVVS